MLLLRTALLLALLTVPGQAQAHGQGQTPGQAPGQAHDHPIPAPSHGGIVAEATGEQWVELVVAGDRITAWVSDENNKPIPSAQLGGKATVLVAGRREEVALAPGEGNSLSGKLATVPAAKLTAVLTLSIKGKMTQAKFAMQ